MRLAPLLTGTSAGSLGPTDLEEIGVTAAAVDVLELVAGPGLDQVEAVGGLRAFTGWEGAMVAVARAAPGPTPDSGWRARRLPQLFTTRAGVVKLRSAVDGRVVPVDLEALLETAIAMGADSVLSTPLGPDPVWTEVDAAAPFAMVVSTVAQDAAASGRFWDGQGWRGIAEWKGDALAAGCECRACRVAAPAYIAHLWNVREITGQHLLDWHNLDRMRQLVEAGGKGPASVW